MARGDVFNVTMHGIPASLADFIPSGAFSTTKASLLFKFSLCIATLNGGKNESDRFEKFNESEKNVWRKQILLNIQRQYYHVKGFDISGGFFYRQVIPIYQKNANFSLTTTQTILKMYFS